MGNKRKFVEINPSSSSSSSSSWGYLPEHLLDSILDRLTTVSDYLQFAAVCKQWFSAARFHHMEWQLKSNPKQLPILLIPTDDGSETHRRICSIAGKELNLNNNNKQLHVPYNRRCCGSSFGWLIFALDTFALILYNPFTGSTIHLPPFLKEADIDTNDDEYNIFLSPQYGVQKVVLSEDPGLFPDTYQVLVLHDFMGYIYLFKSGSDSWIHIDRPEILQFNIIEDIVYYHGKFYLAGTRLLVSVEADYRLKLQRVNVPADSTNMQKFYLVESCNGDLLYIGRVYIMDERDRIARQIEPLGYIKIDEEIHPYENCYASLTRRFLVYKLNIQDHDDNEDEDGKPPMGNCEFELKTSLGGESIFLGISHSISILACDIPGCQPNCIYYTDDESTIATRKHGSIDNGVFDINDDDACGGNNQKMAKHLYATPEKHIRLPPPIWIIPRASFSSII